MTTKIILSPEAQLDLMDFCDYLDESDPEVSMRFFDAARSTFVEIARMPLIGQQYEVGETQSLRKWRIKGFRRYLIFYRVKPETIEIVRLLHGSQDVDSILTRNL
ncbi:MAG: type II toxin-antitoxin system RelE/ParE family toxin [Alkalinema sp. RU_4_3]|nr:type II toxin-antitoxin system RelE/ParE family toxin [Alkalinema sp. RU_4_3]